MFKKVGRCLFSTVNAEQMKVFETIKNWWHPNSPMYMLFLYNYERIKFLKKNIKISQNFQHPLLNMRALDVGCGAGFLSESLTRLGANVVGLDPNPTSYEQATRHKGIRQDLKNLEYKNTSIEQFLQNQNQLQNSFDIVTSMQVIEHVDNPKLFVANLASACKPNGLIMLSTIRRSLGTYLTHILAAQKIIGFVPSGTHHHEKFINPDQCTSMMVQAGIEVFGFQQYKINIKGQFQQAQNGGNYLIIGRKISKLSTDCQNQKIQQDKVNI